MDVSSEPPPGIKLWMNVAWYELQLYKESRTQEDYINKIFNRLKTLRTQQRDQLAAMNAQGLPNRGKLNRLDFSYYNNMNMNPRASPPSLIGNPHYGQYPSHPAGSGQHPKPSTPHTSGPMKPESTHMMMGGPSNSGGPPSLNGNNMNVDNAADYWRQHAALKEKYHEDVEKVHTAFKKYVDHMKDQEETDQKKKLRYLLSYVQLCASVLSEDRSTHQPRKLEELDKVYKYIVKIVNPYLKKLRTETDKRTFPSPGDEHSSNTAASNGPGNGIPSAPGSQNESGRNSISGPPQSSKNGSNPPSSGPPPQSMHQQYQQMQQQRHQQLQQQRLQQMVRQQQIPSQQQSSQQPNTNQPPPQTNNNSQQPSPNHTPQRQQPQGQQPQAPSTPTQPLSHTNSSNSLSSGLGLTLDDTSLYPGMDNGLLPMPSATGSNNSFMNFGNDLSPTNFSTGMDLGMLDMDSTALYDGQDTPSSTSERQGGATNVNTGNGSGTGTPKNGSDSNDSGDLLNFVEVL